MSKLHIGPWPKGKGWEPVTHGNGELPRRDNVQFTVSDLAPKDKLTANYTYYIYQGSHIDTGRKVLCKGVSATGTSASFETQPMTYNVEDFGELVQSYQSYLAAVTKNVTIGIASTDFTRLKQSGYNLCFAKKVGDAAYNVVWRASFEYLEDNDFSWVPQYQIFGSNQYKDGITVKASTKYVTMGLGEIVTLNSFGQLGAPSTGGKSTAINLLNEYGPIHPGISQLSTGVDGQTISTPIYAAPQPMVKGAADFTPIEKVLVWFEQKIETSTIFASARSSSVELDLTFVNSEARVYDGGEWRKP
ncbi:hypothetical protein LMG28727_07678 [Paraburkholderia kirstenboschensis]|uniref:hypothetical protein n=1 Tax=Paraburkholderia kirstenboschensis TaxID=1245436 RepID=UPI000B07ABD9|nr:hypothetical protein [Paraburkholderia kirstenboschensis]CAD6562192.1 hypothetical protein LMG28727_07678 [Paraburkholderia kirstenboschensis]